MAVRNSRGAPFGRVPGSANTNDFKLARATLESIPLPRPTPTKTSRQHFWGDRGHDYDEVRWLAEEYGFTLHLHRRGHGVRTQKSNTQYFDAADSQVTGSLQVLALPAVADAQVLASSPNTNFGTATDLTVDRSEAETFLRFSLAGIPANARVAAVSLVAVSYEGSAQSGVDSNVYTRPVQDDTWSETGITWNNPPRTYSCELGSWQVWRPGVPYEVQVGVNSSPKLVAPVSPLQRGAGPCHP
ncbi:DNRLRE domain-containing protein [Pyxidicoccus sp. 3LG]